MEEKIKSIVQKRYMIDTLNKKVNILLLGPDEGENSQVKLSTYKSYASSLEPISKIESYKSSYDKYDKLPINQNIVLLSAHNTIFESRQSRLPSESIISFYKSKFMLKGISDVVNFNILPNDKPNIIAIVLNGLKEVVNIGRFKICLQEYKNKGIFYPHIIITHGDALTFREAIIEKYCIELEISRSCCHFVSCYMADEWESNLEKDMNFLQLIYELIQ
ncbi:hypothetical protein SteCoe_29783 [Stentor coeruleus]|uniref:Uncharacterized protein n=1 Tax=Stentor coeruleus TaxID=5963 RepID=A0A1R2B5J8_9CILI|nr:hypothetical protein SteCoe_29783 [Stentor coeruleus]